MSGPDLKAKIEAIKLTTKAARLRQLMPVIEAKLAEGVRAAEIVETLRNGGLELTMGTFRSYLHQYRAKRDKNVERRAERTLNQPEGLVPYENVSSEAPKSSGPISIQKLDRVMKPDPAEQAEKLARYERLARRKERNGK
jgi:hypothetical protein